MSGQQVPASVPPHLEAWVAESASGPGVDSRVQMSELQVVAMAVGAWFGALLAVPVPIVPGVVTVLGAPLACLVLRRPWLLVVAVGLAASALGAGAEDAFVAAEAGRVEAEEMVVLDDPRPLGVGWRATVRRASGRRLQAIAHGRPGFQLSGAAVGDRLLVDGRVEPTEDTSWTRSRHIVGSLNLSRVDVVAGPDGMRRVIETIRGAVVAGAEPLPEEARPLYLGLVVGEDRFQPPEQRARFRAVGLAHLLAVSGQNVAFVLTVVRPVIDLLPRRARFVAIGLVLALFATATRLEPSVLRATLTAGLAALAATGGHRQSGVRLLGLAVAALVLIDPFLVYSVGFQLSVSASFGILVLAPVLADRLPGPGWFVDPLAVTLAAQAAVLPVIARLFGPVSIVSVPANLAAGWAAGAVMMWGLTAGVVAGAVGGAVGRWLQLVPLAALGWLDEVAAWGARVPAPALSVGSLLALIGLGAARWLVATRSNGGSFRRGVLRFAALVLVASMVHSTVPPAAVGPTALEGGGRWLPAGRGRPSVLVIEARADERLLDALLVARVRAVDVMIVEGGTVRASALGRSVMNLVPTGVVLAPPRHRLVGATRLTDEVVIATALDTLVVTPEGNRLTVAVSPRSSS